MVHMMMAILNAAAGGALKGLRSLTKGGKALDGAAGVGNGSDIPPARTVRDDLGSSPARRSSAESADRAPHRDREPGHELAQTPSGSQATETAGATRLPQDGTWTGEPGYSVFIPNRSSKQPHPDDSRVVDLQPGEGIPFKNGRPDFSRWAVDEFKVPGLDGTRRDRTRMALAVAERYGLVGARGKPTAAAGLAYMERIGVVPHHAGGDRVQLVPHGIHGSAAGRVGVPHVGGASDLRNQSGLE